MCFNAEANLKTRLSEINSSVLKNPEILHTWV